MSRIVVMGGGAGGMAATVDLTLRGFQVIWWRRTVPNRPPSGFRLAYRGVCGDGVMPVTCTNDLSAAKEGAAGVLVCLPSTAHRHIARLLAEVGCDAPVVLAPGHLGGALEVAQVMRNAGVDPLPPLAEGSTLPYTVRAFAVGGDAGGDYQGAQWVVNITGAASRMLVGCLPSGEAALALATRLYPGAVPLPDVLAVGLAEVNMVLHPPGSILAAAWVEATGGDFRFYVDGMTSGVASVMERLDAERLAVAGAFGYRLGSLMEEMAAIGTVEPEADLNDIEGAISGGKANARIMAPHSLGHRYYTEDFGYGLLPLVELAKVAGVKTPVAEALLNLASAAGLESAIAGGRTLRRLGLEGLSVEEILSSIHPCSNPGTAPH
ncbi:MAG: NAD/NADP octopine/nopaline dehydrogenase family protein [bacterium]|nr:NAD/NADP octopine/nopaline dehydrogenase family protein [Acidimicrobiia bacterium]MCY4651465.1 NAD/NADP octopine/nopaline dehydrogenase family protein [bacterium]